MRAVADYVDRMPIPLLRLYIHGAPHRRITNALNDLPSPVEVRAAGKLIECYRACLFMACRRIGLVTPINHPIDLAVHFFEPTSPDLGNVYLALEQALDGRTFSRHAVLADDSLIQNVSMGKALAVELDKLPWERPWHFPATADPIVVQEPVAA